MYQAEIPLKESNPDKMSCLILSQYGNENIAQLLASCLLCIWNMMAVFFQPSRCVQSGRPPNYRRNKEHIGINRADFASHVK